MPNNINISSGSDFSKKKFGSITKLTKPTFVHNGRVFSDQVFKNQQNIPLIENNIYYIYHGLPDEYVMYEEIFGFINEQNYGGMSLSKDFIQFIQSINNINPIEQRAIISFANSIMSSSTGGDLSSTAVVDSLDPYTRNPLPTCPAP